MRTARKEENKKNPEPLLFRLTRRTILFLFLSMISVFIYYIAGNYQLFLDSSQQIILNTVAFLSAALIILSIAGCIEAIILFFYSKGNRVRYSIHFFLFLLSISSGIVFQLISTSVDIMSNGINLQA